MTIGTTLQRIAGDYLRARQQPLTKHPLAEFIRGNGLDPVKAHLQESFPGAHFLVVGSPGQGNWAEVPWIGVFLPAVTDSATKGYYVVYLFSADMRHCYGARLVADYQPSIPVEFTAEGRFSLSGIDITKAHDWEGSIIPLVASILTAWRQINA